VAAPERGGAAPERGVAAPERGPAVGWGRLRAGVVAAALAGAVGLATAGDAGPRELGPVPRLAATAAGAAATAADGTVRPVRLRIPAIGVDTALEDLRLDADGALAPPRHYALAGWYAEGTPPGETGPAVIAGHVDSPAGPAVFARLSRLRPGDVVQVVRGDGTVTFRVVATGRFPKRDFPTAAVHGPTPDAQLRLVTCGGSFDAARRSYRDNVVVWAARA
jgi:LPXTG-site transpeptidase (sortase) family protein